MTNPTPAPTSEKPAEDGFKETVRTFVYAVLIALVIRTFLFEPFNIPSSSMEPTLLVGDYLFVNKFEYGYSDLGTFWGLIPFAGRILEFHHPQRGDVVVFKWPGDDSTDYIKRVIGLPGDTVQEKDGQLYLNGKPVPRTLMASPVRDPDAPAAPADAVDYKEHLPERPTHVIRHLIDRPNLENTPLFTVPPGHYFMMGDNRDNSRDSRDPTGEVGYVPAANLVGKADILFFSLGDDTSFWEVWDWPWAVRWSRVFRRIV